MKPPRPSRQAVPPRGDVDFRSFGHANTRIKIHNGRTHPVGTRVQSLSTFNDFGSATLKR
jgi:hypothetical protein